MNRAPDDIRQDGVVKTHTIFNEPIYREPLDAATITKLIETYHEPYHAQLSRGARRKVVLGVDCHTMLAASPPIDPNPGVRRPAFCISNADGTCPDEWLRDLAECLEDVFEVKVSLNDPFRGGHIIRSHASELPWVQVEASRDPFQTPDRKRNGILRALQMWCSRRA